MTSDKMIVTKVNANGDTIRRERDRSVTSMRKYAGNFEWHDNDCVYNTATGHYDIKAGEYYRYVRDRLGSTVAVTDGAGNLVQATGYYPSGTPYKLPASVATDIDAATEKLHIGNKWIGHKGFDIYDNTARMHDPLLARFHTIDPLFGDYPGNSPWSHCAANPLSIIDIDGRRLWSFDENGYFTVLSETEFPDDEKFVFKLTTDSNPVDINKLDEGTCITLPKGSIITSYQIEDGNKGMDYIVIRGDENGMKLFKGFSTIVNSRKTIEFSLAQTGYEGEKGLNFLSTSHLESKDTSMPRLFYEQLNGGYTIRTLIHNHPSGLKESEIDKKFFKSVISFQNHFGFKVPKFLIFLVPQDELYEYEPKKH